MSTIKDYGRALPGAAKDRKTKINGIHYDPDGRTLGEQFPTPDWAGFIKDGARAINVGAARAVRELLTSAPKDPNKLRRWERDVRESAALAEALINPATAARTWSAMERDKACVGIVGKARLYEAFGHDRSLSDVRVFRHEKILILARGRNAIAMEDTMDDIIAAAKKSPEKLTGQKMTWFTRPLSDGSGGVMLCARVGSGALIDVETAPSLREAKARLNKDMARLDAAFEQARAAKPRTAAKTALRTGPMHRLRNVSPEDMAKTFGLSAVQFGASLSPRERQTELNTTYDALADLAEVLGTPRDMLGLRETLGISFAARGQGGKGSGKAHYEPSLRVINMTKSGGTGSLAHEWFHGFDNTRSPRRYGFLSQDPIGSPLRPVMRLCEETGLETRSRRRDAKAGKKYFSTPEEMAARVFEGWVQFRMTAAGRRNDHLVEMRQEPELGTKDAEIWPYPLASEMPAFDAAFSAMFRIAPVHEPEDDGPIMT